VACQVASSLDLELGVLAPLSQVDGGDSSASPVEDVEVVGEPALSYGPEYLRAPPLGILRPYYGCAAGSSQPPASRIVTTAALVTLRSFVYSAPRPLPGQIGHRTSQKIANTIGT
jgi:hypothetical protein